MTNEATPAKVRLTDGLGGMVGNRIGDISDLPDSLLSQLSRKAIGELDAKIMDVIRSLDGLATTDEIMVSLWRRHKVLTEDRRALANRLYRMTTRGQLQRINGRKGTFRMPHNARANLTDTAR